MDQLINRDNAVVNYTTSVCDVDAFIVTLNSARAYIAEAEDFEDWIMWSVMLLNWPADCCFNMEPATEWVDALITEAMSPNEDTIMMREFAETRLYHQLVLVGGKDITWEWTDPDWR